MRKSIVTLCVVSLLPVVILCGCQTAKGPSDEELLSKSIQDSIAAIKAGDIEKLLAFYSESFTNAQMGDKKGFKGFVENAKGMGYLKDLQIDMSQAKIVITGKTATVGPVSIEGGFGSTTANFSGAKEKDGWKITGMDINM